MPRSRFCTAAVDDDGDAVVDVEEAVGSSIAPCSGPGLVSISPHRSSLLYLRTMLDGALMMVSVTKTRVSVVINKTPTWVLSQNILALEKFKPLNWPQVESLVETEVSPKAEVEAKANACNLLHTTSRTFSALKTLEFRLCVYLASTL